MEEKSKPFIVYTFGSYMKYERRQYELLGFRLPRPVSWRMLGYYALVVLAFLFLRFFPLTSWLMKPLADASFLAYYIVIPFFAVWGLDSYKTDGKSFLVFARSWILFQLRPHKMSRSIRFAKPKRYIFKSPIFIQYNEEDVVSITPVSQEEVEEYPLTLIEQDTERIETVRLEEDKWY
ncbi:TPA: conjugal transfer protein [Bacillus cereus]|nr:conjugal transfer protein [Bacillus cereus]